MNKENLFEMIIVGLVVTSISLCSISIGQNQGERNAARYHATLEPQYTIISGDTIKIDSVIVYHK